MKIDLSTNKDNANSVKIMTIHTSKGLEYPICYFPGLEKGFNVRELNDKIYYSNKYGIVIPYFKDNLLHNTIIKTLLQNNYYEEEISEKLRLLYVALTRAREKIIFVTSLSENILSYKDSGVIDIETRLSYRSFLDILNSIYKSLKSYIVNVDIKDLNLTKNYNLSKYSNYLDNLLTGNIINVKEYIGQSNTIEESRLSKSINKLLTREEQKNIELGLRIHHLLEVTDFNNPDYSIMNDYEKELVSNFINLKLSENALNVYKEYEFIYEEEKKEIHGIIDLLIIYSDYAIIVDYKLKNTSDDAYIKQLNGYRNYVEQITNLKTKIYLYSIIDSTLKEV